MNKDLKILFKWEIKISIEFDSKSTNSTPLENLNNKQYHHKFSHQKYIHSYSHSNKNYIKEKNETPINNFSIEEILNNPKYKKYLNDINSFDIIKIEENLHNFFYPLSSFFEKKNSLSLSSSNTNDISEDEENIDLKFYRNSNELRNNYYEKLLNKNILISNNFKKNYNSIFLFDWDDTLFPTSYLSVNGIYNGSLIKLTKKEFQNIKRLEIYVREILSMSIERGKVFIVTNSSKGWVEASCKKYYNSILPLLNKIKIISCREIFDGKLPIKSNLWKLLIFNYIINLFDHSLLTNIICIGDNNNEIEAGKSLNKYFNDNNCFVKTILFRKEPNLEEMNKQLLLVSSQFIKIYSKTKNINIKVEKKKRENLID